MLYPEHPQFTVQPAREGQVGYRRSEYGDGWLRATSRCTLPEFRPYRWRGRLRRTVISPAAARALARLG